MAWENEMVGILREMVGDYDKSKYSDARLEEVILSATTLVMPKVDFSVSYTVDLDLGSLSPDPTSQSPKDYDFINLVCLRATALLLNSEAKTAALQSYRVVDGPSTIDGTAAAKAMQQLAKTAMEDFERAVFDYQAGNSVGAGAVLTPYTTQNINVGNYNFVPRNPYY